MAVDPSIILGIQAPKVVTPEQILSLKALQQESQQRQMQMAEQQRQMQVRSAMTSLYSNPANVDPATGFLRPEAMAQLRAIDPRAAMDMQSQMLNMQHLQATTRAAEELSQDRKTALEDKRQKRLTDAMAGQVSIYDATLKSGATPDVARQRAIQLGDESIDELEKSGMFPAETIVQMRTKNAQFDPDRARAHLMSSAEVFKEGLQAERKAASDAKMDAEPPKTRNRIQGDREIQEEWDPKSKTWHKVGEGPRFAKQVGGEGGADKPAESAIGKLNDDLRRGKISKEDHDREMRKLTGDKAGLTVADKMNPVMLATVTLDVKEGRKALEFMEKAGLDKGSPFYADEHDGSWYTRLLKKGVTPESQQEFDVYANKLGQAIASAQSMGRGAISEAKINEARKMIPVIGDTAKIRKIKMQQLKAFFGYVDEVLKTPIKGDARTAADDQADVNDFSGLWK